MGKEWTAVEPDSEIKLVRVSEGTFRARFLCEIRVLGWFVYLCMGFVPRSILKVLRENSMGVRGTPLARVSSKWAR